MTGILRAGLVLGVLLGCSAPAVRAAEAPRLDGVYRSEGKNPDGSAYHGVVQLARRGDSFVVTWMIAQATPEELVLVPSAVGIGVVDAGVLAVSYYASQMSGIVLYRIEDGGRLLIGRWAIAGADGAAYTETLTRFAEDADLASLEPPQEAKPRPPVKSFRPSVGQAL